MNEEKIKPVLTGSAETMLQSFYARAKYSRETLNKTKSSRSNERTHVSDFVTLRFIQRIPRRKNHKFYDAKAIELVEKIDYDFSKAEKDSTMSNGVIARTIVFDELVKDFIDKNPDCTVVNIACGLDTRFYRMDNGRITWYNVDLPETIEVRDAIYNESGRVSTIGISALDPEWAKRVTKRGKMLFIIEGLSMYLTAEENAQMLSIIRDNFDNAYVLLECLAKKWVNKEHTEKSIQDTGAKFVFGADTFDDLGSVAKGFRRVKDDNIIRGMTAIMPIVKPFQKLPFIKKMTQKILIFEKA